ncbi:MAG: hypothetical protein GX369_01755 [Euryarchaeota archaeon]|nr:hypothetical protein [Euryarchaeota archaeon]
MQRKAILLSVVGLFSRRKKDSAKLTDEQGIFIRCPACHKELHKTMQRCPYCSSFLEVTCSNCDRSTNRSLSRCPYCGSTLKK